MWIVDTVHECDRRTDRFTITKTALSIASRGKKNGAQPSSTDSSHGLSLSHSQALNLTGQLSDVTADVTLQ